jgi:hypothetical protein
VIFAGAMVALMGMFAIVVDISWYWSSSLKIQRAADAAALAGAVALPGDRSGAYAKAFAEATKNGYSTGGTVNVRPCQDTDNVTAGCSGGTGQARQLNVTISAPVNTFFMRVFGLQTINATRVAKAEFVLPVPMGSPQNFYGVFGPLRTPSGSSTPLTGPGAQSLTAQGFWATMHSQGAEDIDGDAFLPNYELRTGTSNSPGYDGNGYDAVNYYNYGVQMDPAASNGEVWIFDPGFCATDGSGKYGTGDRWFSGNAATTAYFQLWDTNNTPYDTSDDTRADSLADDALFELQRASDPTLNGPTATGVADCRVGATTNQSEGRYWHNRWWRLASGLQAGKAYRLKTSSTGTSQLNADGHNSFAIWATATGTAPRVYGLATMEAYTPLNGGGAATFYLAQIDAVHAGKTLEIRLWDAGDTGSLSANLQILAPTTADYVPATFTWTSAWGTANSGRSACNNQSGSSGTSPPRIVTNTGGAQVFNGCWLTISVDLDPAYTAPRPATETLPQATGGWWKIRYNMGGATTDSAFDLTTWQVSLKGNPVHLLVP